MKWLCLWDYPVKSFSTFLTAASISCSKLSASEPLSIVMELVNAIKKNNNITAEPPNKEYIKDNINLCFS